MSFKEDTSFLMTTVKSFKELNETNVFKTNKDFDLLKSAAIYGQNASGKSNFIVAISCMSWIINNSFSDSLKKESERLIHDFQFKLNTATENENTLFEVSFLIGDIIYRYGFEINGNQIISEWLYNKDEREILLFNRIGNEFEINKTKFKEGLKYKNDVNQNVLFLSHLSQNNQQISKSIWLWFQKINEIDGLDEEHYNKVTTLLLKNDSDFKKWVSQALKFLEISNIESGENDDIYTFHNKYDKNNLLVGSESFRLEDESAGTRKLIQILGPIYDTLKLGKILFIDEFDSKLHPNLSKKLLEFFNKFNKNHAQFIFSAQDSNLLDKKLLRRDQIWFVEKNQFGASSIYSLSDFNSKTVRNDSAFDKKYLENNFGAADTFEIDQNLMDLLYV
ncbi:AAA family ATPase [Flavobacterium yafengii]|uniref:AAA family ATPase n=1 Tax=Flavobacterium yafengii TaxID=3041253 RepID=UPI0024AA0090|nr:ATP-binding protein [Flavobacterium yafengii]